MCLIFIVFILVSPLSTKKTFEGLEPVPQMKGNYDTNKCILMGITLILI